MTISNNRIINYNITFLNRSFKFKVQYRVCTINYFLIVLSIILNIYCTPMFFCKNNFCYEKKIQTSIIMKLDRTTMYFEAIILKYSALSLHNSSNCKYLWARRTMLVPGTKHLHRHIVSFFNIYDISDLFSFFIVVISQQCLNYDTRN